MTQDQWTYVISGLAITLSFVGMGLNIRTWQRMKADERYEEELERWRKIPTIYLSEDP